MLAHQQGGLLNAAQIARGLGVSGTTVAHYLDLMVDLLLVRRLPPRLAKVGKRMVRSPKVYVRDSGLAHVLTWRDGREWAVEVKRSLSPKLERGLRSALEDLRPERSFVVYPGSERYALGTGVEAIDLASLSGLVAALA